MPPAKKSQSARATRATSPTADARGTTRSSKSGAESKAKTARRSASGRRASAAKRLVPRKEKRGLDALEIALPFEHEGVAPLVREVIAAGGAALGAYREPLSGRPLLLAALPLGAVEPTPFQRDLSPTHTKRLAQKIEESGCFLDPLIVVRGLDGRLWTPNGRHRLAAAKVLGLKQVTALVSPDEDLAFRILALNTEKAHNLREKSLEVVRMVRALAVPGARAESSYALYFEEPGYETLGMCYEQRGRFSGGAYFPILRRVDTFLEQPLDQAVAEREERARRLLELDDRVVEAVAKLKARGLTSPYLKAFVVARINPLRWIQGDLPTLDATLSQMIARATKFNPERIKQEDLAASGGAPDEAD